MSKVLTYTITNKYAEKPKADENDKQHTRSPPVNMVKSHCHINTQLQQQ